jgi:hypothetical protein
VYAKTKDKYNDILSEFKDDFYWNNDNLYIPFFHVTSSQIQETTDIELKRQALVYVLRQWLVPYYQYIVHTWVNQFFYCNTTIISRLKRAHLVLKRWIGSPSKDLTRV